MRLDFDSGQNFSMFLAARVIFVTVLLGVAILFQFGAETPRVYAALLLANAGFSIGCWEWFRRGGPAAPLKWLALTSAVCIDTLVLHFAGGPDSEFVFLHFFSVGAAGALTGLTGSIWTAALSSGGIAWLYYARSPELITRHGIQILVYSINFLLTALLTSYIFRRLRERERSHARTLGELEQTRLDTQAILDSLQSGVIVRGTDGQTMYFNPAGRAILELPADADGRTIAEILAPGRKMGDVVAELVANPRKEPRAEFELDIATGKKPIGLSVSPLQDRSGSARGHIILFGDLTRTKEAERIEREREQMAAIGRLSRDLAHEIRNPLATIRGSVEMLRAGTLDASECAAYHDLALRESDRLNGLLRDFLVFAHLESPHKQAGDLATTIRERIAALRSGIPIEDRLPAPIPREYDPDQISLTIDAVLLSLLEWSEGRGRIRTEQIGGSGEPVRFTLEGVVVPRSSLEAVFQPFSGVQQFSNGLAVPTALRAVHAHGGRLSLTSANGIGTWYELAV